MGHPVTLVGFMAMYPTQDACRRTLLEQRWREGFRCPRCAHALAWYLRGRSPRLESTPQAAGEPPPWVHIVTLQLQALATRRLPGRQRRAQEDRISPASSGSSHCCFCWSVPNIASTSMFPVSGAEQFSVAGARWALRPVISASGAYCRFVSPAPCSPGRKRFHRPRARASALSSWSTGALVQAHGSSRASIYSAKTGSAG